MPRLPLPVILVVFALSAGLIWWAGTRLERLADVLSRRSGLGHAFTGVLLLAAASSLPEVATTVTAVAVLRDPSLAVHNLVGGVAFQTVVLAIADASKQRPGALTWFSPRFVLLIEAVAVIALLALVITGAASESAPAWVATSVWTLLIVITWVLAMRSVYRHRDQPRWSPSPFE